MSFSAILFEDTEQCVGYISDEINTVHLDGNDIVSAQLNGHDVNGRTRIWVYHEQRLHRIVSKQPLDFKSRRVVNPEAF